MISRAHEVLDFGETAIGVIRYRRFSEIIYFIVLLSTS